MSLEIFKQIKELLESWDISVEDWMVGGKHARIFAGYEVELRKAHINIVVNHKKIPWKYRFLNFAETIPKKKTSYFYGLVGFARSTGYDLDITPLDTDLFEQLKKNKQKKQIDEDFVYYVSILDNLKILKIKLDHCNEKELGIQKGLRLLEATKDLIGYAERKKEIRVVEECKKILKDYSHIKLAVIEIKEELTGIPLGKGKITGKVVIFKEGSVREVYDPMILVTDEFSTKQLAHFDKIIGIITETGGLASHPALLSDEFDLPVIIGVKDATKLLRDGQYVTMHLDTGRVEVKDHKS